MPFDVFISYPHEDKATADAACATLEAKGVRCWIAPRDVAPSADWAASIVDAIEHCRVMVLIFSAHANRSKQVHREVQQAFDREKAVLPLRIENIAPESTLRYYMGLDAFTSPLEYHLQQLVASVSVLLGMPTSHKHKHARTEQALEFRRLAEEERRRADAGAKSKAEEARRQEQAEAQRCVEEAPPE